MTMPSIDSGSVPAGTVAPGLTLTLTTKPMPSSRVAPMPANHGSLPYFASRVFLTWRANERLLMNRLYLRTDARSCSTPSPAEGRSLPGRCVCSVMIQYSLFSADEESADVDIE